MKLEKKVYATRAEKQKDFAIGAGVFFGLNLGIVLISTLVSVALAGLTTGRAIETAANLSLIISCVLFILQLLSNVLAVVYFALTRSWIALGMLGTFGALILLAVIVGIVATVVCLSIPGLTN